MTNRLRFGACVAAVAAALAVAASASAPHIYAIRGARLVTVAGAPIPSGTIVLRSGLIDALGADVQVPAGAVVIEGTGMTVYPGLIDMGTSAGVDVQANPQAPQNLRTTLDAERWKRTVIFRPELLAADHLKTDAPELARLTSAGITTVLATPPGTIVKGQSALVNVAAAQDDPQIGAPATTRKGVQVVRAPVALHIDVTATPRGQGYPNSLLGTLAFIRQGFLDAQHQLAAEQHYEKVKAAGVARPVRDVSLTALQPALAGHMPVSFEADLSREILRALEIAREFRLDAVISGGGEADQVTADLKASRARVIYSLNYPTRPRSLAPEADEPVRELRRRAQAPKTPAALHAAGVPFAFASNGLREHRDFLKNAARAVKEGLPADAAVRAMTLDAARIAGAGDRLGSLEKGKIANLIVTDGDLFEENTKVKHVFIDGRMLSIEDAPAAPDRGRR